MSPRLANWHSYPERSQISVPIRCCLALLAFSTTVGLASCARQNAAEPLRGSQDTLPVVAVVKVERRPIARHLTISSELVPFQEIDVLAKQAGFVKRLYVDYGTHVKKGQLMAVLEIPELQAVLQEDQASNKSYSDQVLNAQHELSRIEAQHKVSHLQYERLNGVAMTKPGLVAQQEVDDAQGKDLAAEAQVESAKSRLQVAQSQLAMGQAKLAHDQALYDYSKITAPFSGIITQRYANLGTLMQAGTNSSTQALPLVKLAQQDLFRLTIPVPESYVRYIKIGDAVRVRVPSLDRDFPGKIARFSYDVVDSTRTMHTEVDVPNPTGVLIPGVYAEATLALDRKGNALAVPQQAITQGDHASVLVVDHDRKLHERRVDLGLQTENYAEILSGLQEGDEVVISDKNSIHDGESVRPKITQPETYEGQS